MGKPSREYIYGINPIFETIRAGRRKVLTAYLNKATAHHPRIKKLAEFLEKRGVPIEWADKGRLSDLSKHKEHQGAVLKTGTYPYVPFQSQLDAKRLLLLDNVEDPHNVGAILRSAEIFGFQNVLLSLKGVPDIYPSVVKVSAGASEFLKISKAYSSNRYVREALEEEYQVIALDGKGKTTIENLKADMQDKILLVVGGEDQSVGQFIINKAHHVLRIDQKGKINSLNASVAASIAMFALQE